VNTFDGSTSRPEDLPKVGDYTSPDSYVLESGSLGDGGTALDSLFNAVKEQEAQAVELFPVEVPGLDVRLMCQIDFDGPTWEKWQKLAIPKEKRKRPQPTDLQQVVLMSLVLTETCDHLEYKTAAGEWLPFYNSQGEAQGLADEEFLAKFNQMTSRAMLKKLFIRDAYILRAGTKVVNAAGYGEEGAELEMLSDPT
jgi:hypothetical protein